MPAAPTAFLSYAWESAAHRDWARALATRLRADGVDVKLDQWDALPGDPLRAFMEQAVRESNFVLLVCTPVYKAKTDARRSGVGYEGNIMTAEVFYATDPRKFIPILRAGEWVEASPSWALGKYFIDLRGDPYPDSEYRKLLDALLGTAPARPPLGTPPPRGAGDAVAVAPPAPRFDFSDTTVQVSAMVDLDDTTPMGDALRAILLELDTRGVHSELWRKRSGRAFADQRTHIEHTWNTLAAAQALRDIVVPILKGCEARRRARFDRCFPSDVEVARFRPTTVGTPPPDGVLRLTL